MKNKLLKVAVVGKTNSGKSTLINSFVGENISITNRKINTTQDLILGIKNINNVQIIFYDTPGSNFLKTTNISQKKLKIHLWDAVDSVDLIIYLSDVLKYNFQDIQKEILKISEVNKPIIFVFNKIDLIKNNKILPLIDELSTIGLIDTYFNVSAKFNKNIDKLFDFLISKSFFNQWIYHDDIITNKDDIYISNESTRNSILEYLHKEIPYNLTVKNIYFKYIKNNNLKIKQSIEFDNMRYKKIILGKNGEKIKKIRESSQRQITKILKCKVHLYLFVNFKNEK